MLKKKTKLKSIFKTKLTKTQIFLSIIILIIIFACLGVYLLSNNTVLNYRMLVYSQLNQAKNNYNDYLQSLTPAPTPKPTPLEITPFPTSTTLIEQLPSQNFNKLIIYQEVPSPNYAINLDTKRISETTIIKELYGDIQNLPFFPQSNIPMSCPVEFVNSFEYVLNFYSITNSVRPAVSAKVHPSGCASVSFTNYIARNAMGFQGVKLKNDLKQTLNLSNQEFYGGSR